MAGDVVVSDSDSFQSADHQEQRDHQPPDACKGKEVDARLSEFTTEQYALIREYVEIQRVAGKIRTTPGAYQHGVIQALKSGDATWDSIRETVDAQRAEDARIDQLEAERKAWNEQQEQIRRDVEAKASEQARVWAEQMKADREADSEELRKQVAVTLPLWLGITEGVTLQEEIETFILDDFNDISDELKGKDLGWILSSVASIDRLTSELCHEYLLKVHPTEYSKAKESADLFRRGEEMEDAFRDTSKNITTRRNAYHILKKEYPDTYSRLSQRISNWSEVVAWMEGDTACPGTKRIFDQQDEQERREYLRKQADQLRTAPPF